jgi:hypothetical protein
MKLDILQNFIAFTFENFSKFLGLEMLLRIMSKILMDGGKKKFNFEN